MPNLDRYDWGYCSNCVRMVPVDENGMLTAHTLGFAARRPCGGGGDLPAEHPGPEAPNEGGYVTGHHNEYEH